MEEIIEPLADAFMSVSVYVAGLVIIFAFAQRRSGRKFEKLLEQDGYIAPLFGALLSVPPGCVGVLTAVKLFTDKRVSFGCVTASFISTMGDSAWLLFAKDPVLALKLKAMLCALGFIIGYLVDYLKINADYATKKDHSNADFTLIKTRALIPSTRLQKVTKCINSFSCGCTAAPLFFEPRPQKKFLSQFDAPIISLPSPQKYVTIAFWILGVIGLALSIPVTFQLADSAVLGNELGFQDIYTWVGSAGFFTSLIITIYSRGKKYKCHDSYSQNPVSFKTALDYGGREVAFITVWLGVIFLIWESLASSQLVISSGIIPFIESNLVGYTGVFIGAIAGLVPACGVEILFASLFVAGGLPLPALVAYLVSMDGNGFIPLAFHDKRSAIIMTIITTIPSIIVGIAFIEFA
ncbi:putative manganese transporter [Pseudomonas fragi]|uniref:Protein of uncharacterized function (DUF2899) n=1 Tax=Pseudomonas fragi TaxID=296 RepID=A0A449IS75_PSEFR|nr:putative manganese transporter [Pseudomonas fragi]VFB22294.1 Protein of uncharacterised function (DUF2899) [Pseudomonas fragi]